MANFWDGDDFHLSNRQTEKLLTTVRMSRFKIQGLYFAWPWKIWVRDKRVLRRKPKAKVAMLRLFREEHKYPLALDTSFRLHCRESPIEAYLKERRRRTRRAWKIRFRSFFRNLFDFEDSNASSTTPWTTKKMLTENLRQIPYKFK